jgi:hypothetical protein
MNSYFDGNNILVISMTVAVSVKPLHVTVWLVELKEPGRISRVL